MFSCLSLYMFSFKLLYIWPVESLFKWNIWLYMEYVLKRLQATFLVYFINFCAISAIAFISDSSQMGDSAILLLFFPRASFTLRSSVLLVSLYMIKSTISWSLLSFTTCCIQQFLRAIWIHPWDCFLIVALLVLQLFLDLELVLLLEWHSTTDFIPLLVLISTRPWLLGGPR